MLNILTLTGSPIKDGSTDILLNQVAEGIKHASTESARNEIIRLNDYQYLPCQSCGKSPEPDFCFFRDDIYQVYEPLVECDVVLFGSPVYFDTVSAQAKLFIDRCNCLRPADFSGESDHPFKKILTKKRLGAIVLVGGERQEFECARKVIAGFFKWAEIVNIGAVIYAGSGWTAGAVSEDGGRLTEALKLGEKIASRILIEGS
ncbi:MAG: flavodoxin family protein [Candidatus Zixiibacteriota bacterium]|nr:MAG: flavodoxin family protein [candidate division Zixibacteria bacterium]